MAGLGGALALELDLKPPPLKGLKIHEWGVFTNGKATGGGELPSFVQRVTLPDPPPPAQQPRKSAREPVIHIYAPEPLTLSVQVSFPAGKPTVAWPPAQVGRLDASTHFLAWKLQTLGEGKVKLLEVPETHWIAAARKAESDALRVGDHVERFLFYEGEVVLKSHVSVHDRGDYLTLSSSGPEEAWLIRADPPQEKTHFVLYHHKALTAEESRIVGHVVRDERALMVSLHQALIAAGLTGGEAGAMLDIWMPLLTKPGERLVYLLPRTEYDRLLPITFNPRPEELVRVGLVVQELTP